MSTLEHFITEDAGGQEVQVFAVDESPTLVTQHRILREQEEVIRQFTRQDITVQLLFTGDMREDELEPVQEGDGWFPIFDRHMVQSASGWHAHYGVEIHTPRQEGIVVPTGISSGESAARAGKAVQAQEYDERSALLLQAQEMGEDAYRSDAYQNSGYSLVIPEGVTHCKWTMHRTFSGGGAVHRKRFD
jgi:hypothetical protein|tara:strand:+ start:207 stop:773 length:567 start_codon:yes stop_codon:yes gene_type:complete